MIKNQLIKIKDQETINSDEHLYLGYIVDRDMSDTHIYLPSSKVAPVCLNQTIKILEDKFNLKNKFIDTLTDEVWVANKESDKLLCNITTQEKEALKFISYLKNLLADNTLVTRSISASYHI